MFTHLAYDTLRKVTYYLSVGIRVENLRLAATVLDKVDVMFIQVEAVSVEFLEVSLPSWSQPLSIKIRGLRFDMRQRNMPKVGFYSFSKYVPEFCQCMVILLHHATKRMCACSPFKSKSRDGHSNLTIC